MLRTLTIALWVFIVPSVIAADTGDCDRYSLAGVRLGMTLDEVRAALPKATLTAPGGGDDGEWRLARAKDKKANLARLDGSVTLAAGKVARVDLDLAPKPGPLRLSTESLVAELTSRLGPGASTSIDPKGSYASLEQKTTTWTSSECAAKLVIDQITETSYHAGAPLVFPKDAAHLMRLGDAP